MYLLDTDVVSELRRTRPHGAVLAWIRSVANEDVHLSAVTIGEIQAGIERSRDQDPGKATELEAWLNQVAAAFNILPMNTPAFRRWAELMHRKSRLLIEDAMIAATAQRHHLTVVTRNTADFKLLGVPLRNPFLTPP